MPVDATVVTSDDPAASERIASFGAGTTEWLVAIRMVSEGVDFPRLRVGVYATATTTINQRCAWDGGGQPSPPVPSASTCPEVADVILYLTSEQAWLISTNVIELG
jgi:hypothetical protein